MVTTTDFIGLSKKAAQNLSEKSNLIFRLIKVDGEDFFSEPTDKVNDRICIWIDNGKVTKAVFT